MPLPQSLLPGELTSAVLQKHAYTAHENLGTFHSDRGFKAGDGGHAGEVFHPSGVPGDEGGLRPLVRDSWERSLRHLDSPEAASSPLVMDQDELEEYRRQHPLAAMMPVIHKLLVRPSHDSGMLVAVGDEHGRLLWVEGDAALQQPGRGHDVRPRRRLVRGHGGHQRPGHRAGPGPRHPDLPAPNTSTASVHPWSCTAVPFHDPDSGACWGSWTSPARSGRGPAHPVPGGGHGGRGRRPICGSHGCSSPAASGRPPPGGGPRPPRDAGAGRATACTATACSSWAATRPCSASTAAPSRCRPAQWKSWPCSHRTRKG